MIEHFEFKIINILVFSLFVIRAISILFFLSHAFHFAMGQKRSTHDVVIYGGTSAALSAAIQVKRMGKTVVVVSPDLHLGGLTSSGLGWTDS